MKIIVRHSAKFLLLQLPSLTRRTPAPWHYDVHHSVYLARNALGGPVPRPMIITRTLACPRRRMAHVGHRNLQCVHCILYEVGAREDYVKMKHRLSYCFPTVVACEPPYRIQRRRKQNLMGSCIYFSSRTSLPIDLFKHSSAVTALTPSTTTIFRLVPTLFPSSR